MYTVARKVQSIKESTAIMKSGMAIPKKILNIEFSFDLAILL